MSATTGITPGTTTRPRATASWMHHWTAGPSSRNACIDSVTARAAYERMRTAHLNAVQARMADHVARLDWSRQQIEDYQNHRLRALLGYARERSSYHAQRLRALDT